MVVATPPTLRPPAPPEQPPTVQVAYREPIPPDAPDDHVPVWAFLWTLFVFKIVTVAVVIYLNPGLTTMIFAVATTWFWMIIPILALAGPLTFRWRLRKLRKRREAFRRSEWLLDIDRVQPGTPGKQTPPGDIRQR